MQIQTFDHAGNRLENVNPGIMHPNLLKIDHTKTRFFRPDGTEMLFAVEQAILKQFKSVYHWAESLGLSGRVAGRMFGKWDWAPQYSQKATVVSALHQRILEAAFQCGFAAELRIDGWLK